MKIPKVCDICGSPTIEGDYGESWYLCSNRECKRSNSNWMFNENFAPYKEEFNKLNTEIGKLSSVKVDGYDIEVETDEVRWIGDGSGNIRIKKSNHEIVIRFYFNKDKVEYSTDDVELSKALNSINFNSRLKEIWDLTQKRNSLFSIKNEHI